LREVDIQRALEIGPDGARRIRQAVARAGADHHARPPAGILHAAIEQHDIVLVAGVQDNIGAGAGYSLTDTARSVGPDFEGTLDVDFPQFAIQEAVAPGVQGFAEIYKRRYGSEPRSGHSLANYVGARLVLDAMQRAAGLDRDKLRAALLATDVPEGGTPNGWGARFDDKGQNLRARPFLAQWKGGRLMTVAPADAAVAPLRPVMGANPP
jgi:branched-chain amino acid transport system substrate-binding protein